MGSSVMRISRAPLAVVTASGSYHSRSVVERQQELAQRSRGRRQRTSRSPDSESTTSVRSRRGRTSERTSSEGRRPPRKDRLRLQRGRVSDQNRTALGELCPTPESATLGVELANGQELACDPSVQPQSSKRTSSEKTRLYVSPSNPTRERTESGVSTSMRLGSPVSGTCPDPLMPPRFHPRLSDVPGKPPRIAKR